MRACSILSLLLAVVGVGAGCGAPLPIPAGISVRATARIEVRVSPPAPMVAVVGSPIVEFFGIPLDDARDVVFVLDCSGSMSDPAVGRLAQLAAPTPPDGSPNTPPPPVDPSIPSGAPPDHPQWEPDPDPNRPHGAQPPSPATTVTLRKIDVAQAELVEALRRLPAGTRLNVLFFNDHLEAFAPTLILLSETNRAELVSFAHETGPKGGTALAPAMRTAFLMSARRVVLLSDGLGNIGGGASAVLRDAREAMRGGVRIDTIGLGDGQDGALMGALAGESGGLYQAL